MYKCRKCLDHRVPLEGDDEEDEHESEDDTADEGSDLKQVQCHGLLRVGMPYHTGVIQEIFPAINKVTVRIPRQHGGCEIQHLGIDRVQAKIRAKISALDGMD